MGNKGYSPKTQYNYRLELFHFFKWLGESRVSMKTINNYRFYLSSLGFSKSSQNCYLIALRSFFSFMDKQDTPVFRKEKIELAKVADTEINFLTSSMIKQMFNQIRMVKSDKKKKFIRTRDRAILELFFATGLRVSELCSLNRDQIDFKQNQFAVVGKGGKLRLVFLSESARHWLKKYLKLRLDKSPALFVYSNSYKLQNRRMSDGAIRLMVKFYAKKAQIQIRVHPHIFRHSFATDLLRNGANLRLIQELLGHKNISSTQIYTHITNTELQKGYKKYHSGNLDT